MKASRRLFFVLSITIVWIVTKGQGVAPTPMQINQFKGTTTLVVLDGRDIAFDAMLSESVKKYWKVTPFEIINSERFEKEKSNTAYSFLVLTQVVFTQDKIELSYNFLNLLLAHPSGDINEMPVIANIPFCGNPFTSSQHIFKTGVLLKTIQYEANQMLQYPKKGKLSSYNRNIPNLKGKTLLISKDDITTGMADSSLLKKYYKNSIKVVSREEVEKAVINETENIAILHKVLYDDSATTGRCYKMIIDANNGTIYYYNMDRISTSKPGMILKKDFRKIRWYPFHWL